MTIIPRLLVIILGLFLFACDDTTSEQAPAISFADTVLLNGEIYTLDQSSPWVEAVAIRDGRYVFVGTSEESRQYIGPDTSVTDLGGGMAMPGINDAHMHPVMGAVQSLYHCRFPIPSGPDEIAQALRGCIDKDPQAEWIVGGQWGSGFFSTV